MVEPQGMIRSALIRAAGSRAWVTPSLVGILTLVGFLIRLRGMGQSLLGDELLLYWDVWQRSARDVIAQVAQPIEVNPPLYHLLARGSQLAGGDPSVMVRLPALLAGTATIPVTYLLGARIADRRAAIVACALVSVSPFGVYFSNEARPYALTTFLAALSTLMLLRAIDQPRPSRWLAYSLTSVAVLYTHYTGVFVLLVQFGWAAWTHRSLVRSLVIWNVLAGILFLPWIPVVLRPSGYFQSYGPFVLSSDLLLQLRKLVISSPLVGVGFERVPGLAAGALFTGAAVVALLAWILQRRSGNGQAADQSASRVKRPGLLLSLMFSSPIGILLASAIRGWDMVLARNFAASFVGMTIAVAVVMTLPRGWIGRATAIVAVGALAWGCTHSFERSNERTDNRAAAHWIDGNVRKGTIVVNAQVPFAGLWPLSPYLRSVTDAGRKRLRDQLDTYATTPQKPYGQQFLDAKWSGLDVAVAFDSIPQMERLVVIPKNFEGQFRLAKQARFPGFQGGVTVRVFENLQTPAGR